MTGIAGHMLLAVWEGAVDCTQHRDHSAGDLLRLFFVRGPIFGVAVVARPFIQEAQRLYEALHSAREIRSTKNLNVLTAAPSSRTCCCSVSSSASSWATSLATPGTSGSTASAIWSTLAAPC